MTTSDSDPETGSYPAVSQSAMVNETKGNLKAEVDEEETSEIGDDTVAEFEQLPLQMLKREEDKADVKELKREAINAELDRGLEELEEAGLIVRVPGGKVEDGADESQRPDES